MVRQDERAPFLVGLEPARRAAYPPGEYVGQESFLRAADIRRLARRAGVGPGVTVLDVCCGIGGPGRLIAAESGCTYLGVDCSASALRIARQLAGDLPCRFEQAHVPPLPDARFDVVLLLETLLAFPDKGAVIAEVARVLGPGGRFALTVEEGPPLAARERDRMPDADTVWLVEEDELTALLDDAGMAVTWREDCSTAHLGTAAALLRSFRARSAEIGRLLGTQAVTELIAAHELWVDWLSAGRVRKVALVAEKR